jgi:hypothetical protein
LVSIVLAEKSLKFRVLKYTAESLKRLLEFSRLNGSESVKIEMSEDLSDSLSFIISSVSFLSDLFENDRLKLLKSCLRNKSFVRAKAPGLEHKVDKVIILLSRKASVNVSVVLYPSLLSNVAALSSLAHKLAEVSSDSLRSLFSGSHSGVRVGIIVLLEKLERYGRSSS